MTLKAEGTFEYQALLFIPSRPPFDLYYREQKFGLQLYVNRVLIMERCEELVPDYLRFVKGVVDSPDLSLNVSREILQNDRRVGQIRKRVVKKVLDTLDEDQRRTTGTATRKFWDTFGKVLKEGLAIGSTTTPTSSRTCCCSRAAHDATAPTSLKELRRAHQGGDRAGRDLLRHGRVARGAREVAASRGVPGQGVRGSLPRPIRWTKLLVDHLTELRRHQKLQSVGKGEVELGTETEKLAAEERPAKPSRTRTPRPAVAHPSGRSSTRT
jgi:molecular chaperone HtpG